MAVVTARRVVKAERVGKQRFGKALAQTTGFLLADAANRMSEHFHLQLPTPSESVPVLSPSFTTQADVTGGATSAESLTKKRKASKSKIPTELRRAVSTPHIRGLTMSDPGGISPSANKPRNKLGYHRTSVACGHCRRRKIRCLLPTPEDPQGRCSNCIRLKKDCNFYPVTEASQHERGSKKGAMPSVPSASNPASPRQSGSSNTGSSGEELQGTIQFPPQASVYHPATQSEPYTLPQVNGIHYRQPTHYNYTPSFHPSQEWNATYSADHSQQPPHPPGSISPYTSWSSAHTPVTSSYQTSPPTSIGAPAPSPFESPNLSYPHGQHAWTQSRSLSFSHVEHGLPQQYQYHEVQGHQPPHLPFPPSLPSNTHAPTTSTEQHPAALPPTTLPPPSHSYQQHWQAYPQPMPLPSTHEASTHERPPPEPYSNHWYQESPQVPCTQDAHAHYGSNPGVYYPQGTPPG